jgi:hypothetical protein
MRQKEIYKTKDIFEAAWIYSKDVPLLHLEPDGKYFWFAFDDLKTCTDLSSSYWSQTATGSIKAFVNSLKTLKDLIFSKQGGRSW